MNLKNKLYVKERSSGEFTVLCVKKNQQEDRKSAWATIYSTIHKYPEIKVVRIHGQTRRR